MYIKRGNEYLMNDGTFSKDYEKRARFARVDTKIVNINTQEVISYMPDCFYLEEGAEYGNNLLFSIETSRHDVAEKMVKHNLYNRYVVDEKGNTAFLNLCLENDRTLKIFTLLVDSITQEELNLTNVKGNTFLHNLAMNPYDSKLLYLIKNGYKGDINCRNNNDLTPLMIACDNNYVNVVEILSSYDNILPLMDSNKRTLLQIVCCSYIEVNADEDAEPDNRKIVNILIEKRLYGDINNIDIGGETALMTVVRNNELDLIRIICNIQCIKDVKNKRGENALSLYKGNDTEVIALLNALQ